MAKLDDLESVVDRMLVTLNVDVAAIAVCEVGSGWQMVIDAMDNPVVHYILEGSGVLRAAEHDVVVTKGSFVVVPAGANQCLQSTGTIRRKKKALEDCIAIADGMLNLRAGTGRQLVSTCGAVSATYGQSLGFFDHLTAPVVVGREHIAPIRDAFENMIDELANPIVGTRAITSALMKQCIVFMVRSELNRHDVSDSWLWTLRDNRLAQVISSIIDRPAENYSVDSLARIAAMSRSSFSKRFAESFNITPIDFLTLVRMNQAAQLLARTRLPVKVITNSVGYSSRSHFSRTFRSRFGESPTAFRNKHGPRPNEQSWQPLRAIRRILES